MRAPGLLAIVLLAGCCTAPTFERPPATGGPDDLTWLIDTDPTTVTDADLLTQVHAAHARTAAATVEGVLWPVARSDPALPAPDIFYSGGDSLLFTGIATAASAWRFQTTGAAADLGPVIEHLHGLYLLTHATGTPGVLCRAALPLSRAAEFGWPWLGREPFVGEHAGYGFYTRATRDQLTGLVLGLAAAWDAVEGSPDPVASDARDLVRVVARDTLDHLVAHEWYIRDANGENDTNADEVDGSLRLGLEALVAVLDDTGKAAVAERIRDHLGSCTEALVSWSNRFNSATQYFAHNLRACRSLSLALLAPHLGDPGLLAVVREHAEESWWGYVRGHRSAWFHAVWKAHGGPPPTADYSRSIRSLSLRPPRAYPSPYAGQEQRPGYGGVLTGCVDVYAVDPQFRKPTRYFTWQKEPWDVGQGVDPEGLGEDIGISLTAPFWLWEAH